MSSIFDFLTGNNNTSDPTTNTGSSGSGDALSSYLGNLIDPSTSAQFQQAQQSRALLGLAAGLLGQGASRTPITFGQSLGAGLQGMMAAQNGATDQALKAAQTSSAVSDTGLRKAQVLDLLNQLQVRNQRVQAAQDQYQREMGGSGSAGTGAVPPSLTSGTLTSGTQPSSSAPAVSTMTADATLPPQARALLDTISGPESSGAYNVRYTPKGGTTFDSYAQHPGIFEPGPQGPSSAAGRYQIVKTTFDPLAKQYGYTDFSPVTQDNAAWNLAQNTYSGKTGRDLLTDLQNGQTQAIPSALAGQWATLAKGMGAYGANLSKYANAGTGPSDTTSGLPNVPNFGGMMGGGNVGAPYTGMPSLPGQSAPQAGPQAAANDNLSPSAASIAPSGYGVPNSQQIAGARYRVELDSALGRTPNPNDVAIAGFATTVGLDAAKAAANKRLEIAGAGPIATAQAAAKDQFAIQPNVTIKNPDGSYSEMALPHPLFRTMIGQQFGNGSAATAPTPVAGTNFAANLPQLPGQPNLTPQVGPQSPQMGQQSPQMGAATPQLGPQALQTAPQPTFDPNVWAARNKAPIGLVNGQLLPIDGRGNAIPNAPGWGTPNTMSQRPQSAPQSTGTPSAAIPGPPAMNGAYGAPQGQPGQPGPLASQQALQGQPGPQSTYQIGKPILNPTAQFNPNGYDFSPKVGTGPGQNAPLVVPATSDHPYTTQIPPLSSQAPLRMSGVAAPEIQKGWVTTTQKMADAQAGLQQSKQLLGAMADIFKRYEGGAFAQYQGEAAAKIQALGIPMPNGMNSPADMQQLMKDNFANAVAQMKATGLNRWTQAELAGAQKNFAGPELQPAASFAIMSQDAGKIMQAEALTRDWNIARNNGWSDPNSFAQNWYSAPANDLATFTGRASAQFGPFKGMSQQQIQQQIPTLGTAPDGSRVMRLPNGKVVPQ